MGEIILSTNELSVDFRIQNKVFGSPDILSAVSKVNLQIERGEIFGLVGESGCGKTTLANAILGFVKPTAGSVSFMGHTLTRTTSPKVWRQARRNMQMVFQDPYTSLDARMPVWQLVSEPLYINGERNEHVLRERAEELLLRVGLGRDDLDRHVFEFSGGQRQRIAIARALIGGAKFIVCDEPVSALDVSVHSQICNLLLDLQQEMELTYLFISHNLSLIKHITKHMAVMYLGTVLECGSTEEIFRSPECPYTQALISSILQLHPTADTQKIILRGEATSPVNAPLTCRFASRCSAACEKCRTAPLPPLTTIGTDHYTSCHLALPEDRNG